MLTTRVSSRLAGRCCREWAIAAPGRGSQPGRADESYRVGGYLVDRSGKHQLHLTSSNAFEEGLANLAETRLPGVGPRMSVHRVPLAKTARWPTITPARAAGLVRLPALDIIVCGKQIKSTVAAMKAPQTIPKRHVQALTHPVKDGLVPSARQGATHRHGF